MTHLLIAAQAARPITIELPTAVSAAAWVITALLAGIGILSGVVAYFLRRELKSNDAAHRELTGDIKTVESDVKKLLAGQGRIEGALVVALMPGIYRTSMVRINRLHRPCAGRCAGPRCSFLPADSRSSNARAISGNAPASTG